MTDTIEKRISYLELTAISLRCTECKGEVTIDTSQEKQRQRFRTAESAQSLVCPLCTTGYDVAYRHAVEHFWNFQETARSSGLDIVFRVPMVAASSSGASS